MIKTFVVTIVVNYKRAFVPHAKKGASIEVVK